MEETLQKIYALGMLYGVKVIAGIAIFIIGRWVAKAFRSVIKRLMNKRNVDPTLTGFVGNLTYMALLAFVVIAALGQLGIQTTSFIAILGAAGLAIGLALQGSLANFASGFLMITFKILKDPPMLIALSELADNSVNFVVRPWVAIENYWGVYFDAMENIKKAFDAAGVSIPYPQRDVHLYEHK